MVQPAGYDILPGASLALQEATLELQRQIEANDWSYRQSQVRLQEADLALQQSSVEDRPWKQWQADLARNHEAKLAELDRQLRRELAQAENQLRARETELRLATRPIDFVAYEKYRRQLQAEGPVKPYKPPSTDEELRAM